MSSNSGQHYPTRASAWSFQGSKNTHLILLSWVPSCARACHSDRVITLCSFTANEKVKYERLATAVICDPLSPPPAARERWQTRLIWLCKPLGNSFPLPPLSPAPAVALQRSGNYIYCTLCVGVCVCLHWESGLT